MKWIPSQEVPREWRIMSKPIVDNCFVQNNDNSIICFKCMNSRWAPKSDNWHVRSTPRKCRCGAACRQLLLIVAHRTCRRNIVECRLKHLMTKRASHSWVSCYTQQLYDHYGVQTLHCRLRHRVSTADMRTCALFWASFCSMALGTGTALFRYWRILLDSIMIHDPRAWTKKGIRQYSVLCSLSGYSYLSGSRSCVKWYTSLCNQQIHRGECNYLSGLKLNFSCNLLYLVTPYLLQYSVSSLQPYLVVMITTHKDAGECLPLRVFFFVCAMIQTPNISSYEYARGVSLSHLVRLNF